MYLYLSLNERAVQWDTSRSLKPQNGLLSELLFRRRQSVYYQTVLFIYVALFISYEEIIIFA